MPRTNRAPETESFKPLINFERIAYEKLTLRLSEPVLTNLKAYAAYVAARVGDLPSADEIVDKGMQRLFDTDRGFKQWLQQQAAVSTSTPGSAAAATAPVMPAPPSPAAQLTSIYDEPRRSATSFASTV